jgi:hypothetical protein
VSEKIEATFESIESACEFVTLLSQAVIQAKRDIECDVAREQLLTPSRRLDALRLTAYTLQKLELHMNQSCRALNDLRTLRRLLFGERHTAVRNNLAPSSGMAMQEIRRKPRAAQPSPQAGSPLIVA